MSVVANASALALVTGKGEVMQLELEEAKRKGK
jgi:hypothetical protein